MLRNFVIGITEQNPHSGSHLCRQERRPGGFRSRYHSKAALVLAFHPETEAEIAENKTKATTASVAAYIDALTDPARRSDAKELVQLMQSAAGERPKMWGPSIVGFGSYHYRYDSGREGDAPLVGFSPRKAASVLYGLLGKGETKALLPKLGKHTTGKGCLYIKKLSDVDRTVLQALIRDAIAHNRASTR